nr:alanine racemase [Nocardia arthritidis]
MTVSATGPALPAIQSDWALRAQADPRLLADIARAVSGPFHVINPDGFGDNLAAFKAALGAAGVDGQIYYGKKANKAGAWLDECARYDGGVDVASAPELIHALAHGIRGEDIVVTGAAKADRLLWLASRHRCLIAIDSLDELDRLIDIGVRVRILLRVLPEADPDSRFGLDPEQLARAVDRCAQALDTVTMDGFSFHLNGYQVAPRVELADRLVDACVAARARGLAATSISIGGGFACSYLESADWQRFRDGYRPDWFHSGIRFAKFYPYHQSPAGARMLAAILGEVGRRFAATSTRLLCEPGRALLDQAGFSVFPVQGFKWRGDHGVVTVAGLSMSLSEQWKGSEFLPEPILWQANSDTDSPVTAFVGGASCLEYDVLTWRKITFPRPPRHGDLLIYPNTAGYQMDKNESEFHQLPLPPKVRLREHDGRYVWTLDTN